MPWFTADGHEVWHLQDPVAIRYKGYKIIERNECGSILPEPTKPGAFPLEGFPWRSAHGYKVVDDGWITNPSGKRLLWLPHSWRSIEVFRIWKGRFLGLLHSSLPEAVILEIYE